MRFSLNPFSTHHGHTLCYKVFGMEVFVLLKLLEWSFMYRGSKWSHFVNAFVFELVSCEKAWLCVTVMLTYDTIPDALYCASFKKITIRNHSLFVDNAMGLFSSYILYERINYRVSDHGIIFYYVRIDNSRDQFIKVI